VEKEVTASGRKRQLVRLVKDNNSVLILVLLLAICFLFVDGYANGFYNVIVYSSIYGVVCLGLGLVMITGNIDLSVGFQAGLAGVTTVLCFNAVYAASGNGVLALVVAIVGSLITGAITGLVNGLVIAKIGVSPLIATIATNYIYKGLVFNFAQSSFAPDDAETVKAIAKTKLFDQRWLTPAVIIFLVIAVLLFLWMRKTRFGNNLHVVGDNSEAAAYAGISVSRTVLITYILCGVLAAVSGFLMVSFDGYAIYTQGNALGTFPISCCVIGGIKMSGGKGTVVHMVLGILIMRAISTMMSVLFLSTDMINLITGILLVAVLIIDRFTSTKSADE
jgi:ribose/xylose/arabinose/galactoside ABC-type transport system permease subunit